MNEPTVPASFVDLEPFSDWGLPSESERMRKRLGTSMEEIQAFYAVMLARIDEVLDYLNSFPLAEFDASQARLMNMALSLAEIWVAVELYGQPDHPFGLDITRFVPGETFRP